MGAPSKKARKTRNADEFNPGVLRSALTPPTDAGAAYSWSLADIVSARDAQLRGQFSQPAKLAASMRTDDALAVARSNRLAPQKCIRVEIVPAKGARALSVAGEAEALYGEGGVAVSPGTLADINGCLVDHGVAFAINVATPREDGSRVDLEVRYWPIEHVRWDPMKRCFMTRVDPWEIDGRTKEAGAGEVPIVHGDGRWIVFAANDDRPFRQEAAILPAAMVWARHAFAIRDWAKSSVAHGSAKVIGEMPEGVALQDGGGLTAEAAAFAELLRSIASSDAPVGIRPFGSKTEFLTNTSTAWQIFSELVTNAEKAAARIYLGTDGTLGAQGGAPGVDIASLFGVATTKVQGDLGAIERGLHTGSIEVWCALNFGDSALTPTRRYMIPDADAEADRTATAARRVAFFADIASARENGFEITQPYVDELAKVYDIEPPKLLEPVPGAPTATPAETPAATPVAPAERPPLKLVPQEPAAAAVSPEAREEHASRMTLALLSDIREAKQSGVRVDQAFVDATAKRYGVPAVKLETG